MEDSTLLSYLKFKKIPVISDSLSFYALAQNKALTKRVLNDLNINNVDFIKAIDRGEQIPKEYIDMATLIPLGFVRLEDVIPLGFIKNSLDIPLGFVKM